jgi:hypothetical protein
MQLGRGMPGFEGRKMGICQRATMGYSSERKKNGNGAAGFVGNGVLG